MRIEDGCSLEDLLKLQTAFMGFRSLGGLIVMLQEGCGDRIQELQRLDPPVGSTCTCVEICTNGVVDLDLASLSSKPGSCTKQDYFGGSLVT